MFRAHSYDFGRIAFTGHLAWPDGGDLYELAPRRHILDTLLADAAAVSPTAFDPAWNGDEGSRSRVERNAGGFRDSQRIG